MQDIKGLTLSELEGIFKEWGKPLYHARQVFSWIYQKGAPGFVAMTDLPADLRSRLETNFEFSGLQMVARRQSRDATEKFLFKLKDGNTIEAVSIPAQGRVTGCISTQVGCKFACAFCASGAGGFKRDLTVGEILDEVLYLSYRSSAGRLTHLVLMGTGEPLDNYEHVIKAIRLINSREGLSIGARRITISTCGLIPAIRKMASEGLQLELSVSLHSADDKIRTRLMPVNRKYPLKELIAACRDYATTTGRQVTFEYILIDGLNADPHSAAGLVALLKGFDAKVNLIPANPVEETGVKPPNKIAILYFKDYLLRHGLPCTLRKTRGQDIEAACGQLRLRSPAR